MSIASALVFTFSGVCYNRCNRVLQDTGLRWAHAPPKGETAPSSSFIYKFFPSFGAAQAGVRPFLFPKINEGLLECIENATIPKVSQQTFGMKPACGG
jgi:hypothetical protein